MNKAKSTAQNSLKYVLVTSLILQTSAAVAVPKVSGEEASIVSKWAGKLFDRFKKTPEGLSNERTANENPAARSSSAGAETSPSDELAQNALSRISREEALKYIDPIEEATNHVFHNLTSRTLRKEFDVTFGRTTEIRNYITNLADPSTVVVALEGPSAVGKTQLSIGAVEKIQRGETPAKLNNATFLQVRMENTNASDVRSFNAVLLRLKSLLPQEGLVVLHFDSLTNFITDKGVALRLDEYVDEAQKVLGRNRVRIVLEGDKKALDAIAGSSQMASRAFRVKVNEFGEDEVFAIVKQFALRLQNETGYRVASDELIQKIITRARVYYSEVGLPLSANVLLSKLITQKQVMLAEAGDDIAQTALNLNLEKLEREYAQAQKIVQQIAAESKSKIRGSFARLRLAMLPDEMGAVQQEIQQLMQNFEKFQKNRKAFTALNKQIETSIARGQKSASPEQRSQMAALKSELEVIQPEDLALIIHREKGVKLDELLVEHRAITGEAERRLKLSERIFGQSELVNAIIKAGNKLRARAANPTAPQDSKVTSILLLGPPGVGKTESAYALADVEFGSIDNLHRFDMSRLGEKHASSIIDGSAPGFVGFGDKTDLVSRIKSQPKAVVLLDEIERAHRSIMNNQFLRVLSTGTMENSAGTVGDFSQSIVMMTSNLGDGILTPGMSRADLENFLISQGFEKAFLNRISEIVVVNPLGRTLWGALFKKGFKKLNEELAARLNYVYVEESTIERLLERVDAGVSPSARDIERAFDDVGEQIRNAIYHGHYKNELGAKQIIVQPGDAVRVVYDDSEGLVIQVVRLGK